MRSNCWTYITITLLFICLDVKAQSVENKIPLTNLLDQITEQYRVQFNYQSDRLTNVFVGPMPQNRSLEELIYSLGEQTSLIFSKIGESIYSITEPFLLCGFILDHSTSQPLYGATITAKNKTQISDYDGYFELKVASLKEDVEIRYLGFKTLKLNAETFRSPECSTVQLFEQEEMMDAVVIRSYLVKGIDKRIDGTTSINFSNFSIVPGLIEADVLQTVQALPGVNSVDETVSNINIRGGSHDQNLMTWDGIKMYQSSHFFGMISSFNPQITKTALVMTNGTDAYFTDGVSGSIQMNTDRLIQKEFKGGLGINFISADIFADIPLTASASVQIAARRSLDDLLRTPTYQTYFDRVTQETEIQANEGSVVNSNQHFTFYDTSLRWLYQPSEADVLRLNFILINNDLTFDESLSSLLSQQSRESNLSQNSAAVGINYRRNWNEHFTTQFDAYNTDYKLHGANANLLEDQRFLQENIVSETGLKLKGSYSFKNSLIETGYQFTETEMININDIDAPRYLRRDSEVLREHAWFLQNNYHNLDSGFSFRTGVRFNLIPELDAFIIEPRLSIKKKIGQYVQFEVLGEFKHQTSSQIVNFQNDFLGVEKRRWHLSDNVGIPILKSKQASFGIQWTKNGWLLDATAYLKMVGGITTQSQGFTTKYEFTKSEGSYQAAGIDLLLRKQIKAMSSWLSYSYMNNDYNFPNLEEIYFPSNFDTTHSFTAGTTYSINSFDLSAGLNFRTGKPTSTVQEGNNIFDDEVNFDSANSIRLPDYYRVDASGIYKIKLNAIRRLEIGASVWNIFNTSNVINHYYRVQSDNTVNKFTRKSLGLTTNFLVRLYF